MQMLSAEMSFLRRVVLGTFLAAMVLLLMAAVWASGQVVLLLLLSMLLALFLRELSRRLRRTLPVSPAWSVLIVSFTLLCLGGMTLWLMAPEITAQAEGLVSHLPESWAQIQQRWGHHPAGKWLLRAQAEMPDAPMGALMSRATGIFNSVLGAGGGLLFVFFMSLYLALDPHRYKNGVLLLFPAPRRSRVEEIMDATAERLWQFLVAQGASMLVVFVMTTFGLWMIGMPVYLALGLLAGLLTFIPYLGPLLSFLPALLVAAASNGASVLSVTLLYGTVQLLESYLITPMMQRKIADLPPALTILVQGALGLYSGVLGVLLAAPLTAAGMVIVKMAYLEDVLQEDLDPLESTTSQS